MPRYSLETNTTAIRTKLYPLVEKAMSTTKIKANYKKYLNKFFANRDTDLYDALPCSRLLCGEREMDELFVALDIPKKTVTDIILETYYGTVKDFNPLAAKHEFTITQLMIVRYFMLKNEKKELELATLLLSFSGKFYPSLHYRSYPNVVPVRYVMEYVVNNCLTKKYDLASYGSVIAAVKSIATTWITTYKENLKKCNDSDCVYMVQQLHSRIGSFMKNIATEYYKAYENKDIYMTYDSDSYDPDDYHIADSDSLRISRYVEATLNYINNNGVNYSICKACSDSNITPNECRAVIESIIERRENILEMKELITLIISTYYASTTDRNKDVSDIGFISYAAAAKPNAKQKEIVRQKKIIEEWLNESGTAYIRRKSREATRNSYEKCVRLYFAITIHNANR